MGSVNNPPLLLKFPLLKGLIRGLRWLRVFSLGRVVLYTVFMVFPLPQTLVKTLAKNLVKNLAKNLVKHLAKNLGWV